MNAGTGLSLPEAVIATMTDTPPPSPHFDPDLRAAPIPPFARSLPMQLMRAREAVMQRFRPHLRAHGITDQQWRVIRALVEAESLEILELSRKCSIHSASLSRILPRLDAAGIITRRVNQADQRRVIVTIAPKGRELFAEMASESEEIYARIARDLGMQRLGDLYRTLDEFISIMSGR